MSWMPCEFLSRMEANIEKECSALGGLFQTIVTDLKSSTPVWEDFLSKATKLHSQLKTTALAAAVFLDSFQKVADMATNTRGATKELGAALTRMCIRHRSIEGKLRHFSSAILEKLVTPLQDRMEDWKKDATQLDKDHAKEYKKARQDIKKKSADTLRLQKKAKKAHNMHFNQACLLGKADVQTQLDTALQGVNELYQALEEAEKNAVRNALITERSRFCVFVSCMQPVVEEELGMLEEITHLQSVLDDMVKMSAQPYQLPPASEQVITDLMSGESTPWGQFHTPPSSPSSIGSRKSSMCSLSSINSSDSRSSGSPSAHFRYRSLSQPPPPPMRLSSVSSHDSGFMSQDTLFLRPPSPSNFSDSSANQMSENPVKYLEAVLSQMTVAIEENEPPPPPPPVLGHIHSSSEHTPSSTTSPSPTSPLPPPLANTWTPPPSSPGLNPPLAGWSNSLPSSPGLTPPATSMWGGHATGSLPLAPVNKPPLPEKPMVTVKAQKSDSGFVSSLVPDFNAPAPEQVIPQPVYVNVNDLGCIAAAQRNRNSIVTTTAGSQSPTTTSSSSGGSDGDGSLALALSRTLSSHQSRSSLGSSGYNTQTTTPSCSEDTISTQESDYSSIGGEDVEGDFDKSSTIPRSGDFSCAYRPTSTPKRPASTAGIPMVVPAGQVQVTPGGVARRSSSMCGPRPPPPVRRSCSTPSAALLNRLAAAQAQFPLPPHPAMEGGLAQEPIKEVGGGDPVRDTTPSSSATSTPTRPALHRTASLTSASPPDTGAAMTVPDIRDSLLEAIKRGVKLRPVSAVNDRSAPKVT
ncbi:protein MTSS 1-like isoform X5 [Branchiostoma floridae]|uniref:Protein MTSS 1-like isoform X5 n=1 Tax=Branchiostoma floridae TaxID=7739 RepID=A0A9J7L8G2_BRAFL|nr:protein MTSS 1-like isoform X5 [Branchiostoma floridae]